MLDRNIFHFFCFAKNILISNGKSIFLAILAATPEAVCHANETFFHSYEQISARNHVLLVQMRHLKPGGVPPLLAKVLVTFL